MGSPLWLKMAWRVTSSQFLARQPFTESAPSATFKVSSSASKGEIRDVRNKQLKLRHSEHELSGPSSNLDLHARAPREFKRQFAKFHAKFGALVEAFENHCKVQERNDLTKFGINSEISDQAKASTEFRNQRAALRVKIDKVHEAFVIFHKRIYEYDLELRTSDYCRTDQTRYAQLRNQQDVLLEKFVAAQEAYEDLQEKLEDCIQSFNLFQTRNRNVPGLNIPSKEEKLFLLIAESICCLMVAGGLIMLWHM